MKFWLYFFAGLAFVGMMIALVAPKPEPEVTVEPDESQVLQDRVLAFGETFKNVALLSTSTLADDLQQNYNDFASPDLIQQWLQSATSAPGRLTSSPWPDHAKIDSMEKQPDGSYRVIFNEELVTSASSTDATSSPQGIVASTTVVGLDPYDTTWKNVDGEWMVVELQKNPYTED